MIDMYIATDGGLLTSEIKFYQSYFGAWEDFSVHGTFIVKLRRIISFSGNEQLTWRTQQLVTLFITFKLFLNSKLSCNKTAGMQLYLIAQMFRKAMKKSIRM